MRIHTRGKPQQYGATFLCYSKHFFNCILADKNNQFAYICIQHSMS